jgi:hypothetical protein
MSGSTNRPGELHDGINRLKRATAELQRRWGETRQQWNDQTAQMFEADYLEAMMPTLRLIVSATDELNEFFRKAVAQCQDQDRYEGE